MKLRKSKVKINWELTFEEFNKLRMCGNIKGNINSFLAKVGKNPDMEI